jgi:hypothetical protein
MVGDRQTGTHGKLPGALIYLLACLAASLTLVARDARAQAAFGEPSPSMNFYVSPAEPFEAPRPRVYIRTPSHPRPGGIEQRPMVSGRTNSFCVRTCDGRFFLVPSVNTVSDVKACEAVCPSTEMQVYSGSDIDSATTERGLAYTKLANAFRFRRETVASCTCNARNLIGLTGISIEDDPTVRSGDIVAQENGFAMASEGGSGRRRMIFRPLSQAKAKALGLMRISAR